MSTPPGPLAHRTAVVTGATSGIGAAIAAALGAQGARVVVAGRDGPRGDAVVAAIRDAGGQADVLRVDLAGSYADLRAFTAGLLGLLGQAPDILVNNAGIYPAPPTSDLTDEDLDRMLAVNVRAPHVLVAELAPAMVARGGGVIVNVGSWMATMGSPIAAMYSATKAAAEQLTRSWAAEFGPHGIRVNTVAPGATLTEGNAAFRPALDAMTATTPAGAVVQPGDIADAVAFLASDAARMVHGATLAVDGGMVATRPM